MEYLIFALIGSVILLLLLMYLFLYLASKYQSRQSNIRLNAINNSSQYRKRKSQLPKSYDDYLAKDKIIEKLKKDSQDKTYDDHTHIIQKSDDIIVGVAKPVGRWSNFIMKQKLGFILAMQGLQGNKKGYWVNVMKAQDANRGKGQNRAR